MIQIEKPHLIPQLGSGWYPRSSPFFKAQKIRVPEGDSTRQWRAGSYGVRQVGREGRLEREQSANGQATKQSQRGSEESTMTV